MSHGPAQALSIRLLGDLALARGPLALALPASKRTRALLGYLVATARAQPRAALCDLLWEGPDDPRAALRWSLTKLRPVVDDALAVRLVANRERVAFEAQGAVIDIETVEALLADGVAAASIEALEQAARALRGEFLDGLDLPACYRFHHWCAGERERYGLLRRAVLEALVERLAADAARALPYGRAMVAADPLAEAAHATLVRLLGAAGRYPDAETHYTYARELLQREIAAPPGGPLDEAIRAVRRDVRAAAGSAKPTLVQTPAVDAPGKPSAPDGAPETAAGTAAAPMPPPPATPIVGRDAECRTLAAALATPERLRGRLLLFVGEPGIGKTRLLDHLAESAGAAGWQVIRGRCYEAEMVRPYGLWLDALRGVDARAVASDTLRHAAPLLGTDPGPEPAGDRARLFAATAALLRALGAARPLVLALDDLQWVDESSAALLHYIVRTLGDGAQLMLAGAARAGEIDDNAWAKRLLQSLVREQRLERSALGPLDAAEVAALLGSTPIEAEQALRESDGNPLYLLALARARDPAGAAASAAPAAAGAADGARTLDTLLAEQIDAQDDASRELLAWAAALGREWRPELLAAAMGAPVGDLLARLERLERRGLLKASGDGRLDFNHDLLRQAVYRSLSQLRRRAIHRQLAHALAAAGSDDPRLHGEVVHHASLADDALLTARACLAAGEQCLRLFANAEAVAVAERGLAHVGKQAQGAERVRLTIALLKLRVIASASPGVRRLPALVGQIERAVEEADALALHAEAASGLHILSWLSQQSNDTEGTRAATLQAERLTRKADATTRCQQLANTGRCLLEVEADMPRARTLIAEADALANSLELKVVELIWGRGLIARADGDADSARACVERAVALARLREDHWREYECLVWLAVLDYERGAFDRVNEHRAGIVDVAQRMGDADAPFAQALGALARLRLGPSVEALAAQAELGALLDALRAADDQAHLAYALNAAAAIELAGGRPAAASTSAREALAAARRVRRPSQIAQALATLVQVAAAGGDVATAQERKDMLAELRRCAGEHPSAGTAAALERAEMVERVDPGEIAPGATSSPKSPRA